MVELKLYDIDSAELNELIDSKRIELKKKNLEYKKLTEKVSEILENNPNILALIEDNEVERLSKEDCLFLQKLIKLNLKMTTYEERNFLFRCKRKLFLL